MHELSLAESMIRIIEEAAAAQHYRRVRAVWLEVGSMASVEPDALRFCFEAVARDTVAQDARLELIEVPATGTCCGCGSIHPVKALLEPCPACGSDAVAVSGGTGLRLKELEVI